MARTTRNPSDYMHIMVRGIGKQILFEQVSDYIYYLDRVKKFSNETEIKIICYCLMDNHAHLLIFDEKRNVSTFMKKLGTSYAIYFNEKYDRVGHLFQGRYRSENIESQEQLLNTFGYILKNPVKAGISRTYVYPWSSYSEYGKVGGISDSKIVYEILGDLKHLKQFLREDDDAKYLDIEDVHNDAWAKEKMTEVLGIKSGTEIQSYSKSKRNEYLVKLKDVGLSTKQIARLTGISKEIVRRA